MAAGIWEPIPMSSSNGVASLGARRLRVSYETKTYEVETFDGETISLVGYVKGLGCPISVEIDVEGAWAEWSEDVPTTEERESLTPHRYLAKQARAERLLRRNILCAVISDGKGNSLPTEIADVLAADTGAWESILGELGWWAQVEPSTEGEAPAGETSPPTGENDSPASSPPTRARTRSR